MIMTTVIIMVLLIGYVFLYLCYILPFMSNWIMIWMAGIILGIPTLLCFMRLSTSKAMKIFEKKPAGKELMIFLRRDGTVIPMYASRPFFGESFLDVPKLGIVHDLGKGSVYRWGDKNIRFALENVNHTPDPRYVNFTNWLYKIGFNNMAELRNTLSGKDNGGRQNIEKIVPYVPVDVAVDELKEETKDRSFKPAVKKFSRPFEKGSLESIHNFLDKVKKK